MLSRCIDLEKYLQVQTLSELFSKMSSILEIVFCALYRYTWIHASYSNLQMLIS